VLVQQKIDDGDTSGVRCNMQSCLLVSIDKFDYIGCKKIASREDCLHVIQAPLTSSGKPTGAHLRLTHLRMKEVAIVEVTEVRN